MPQTTRVEPTVLATANCKSVKVLNKLSERTQSSRHYSALQRLSHALQYATARASSWRRLCPPAKSARTVACDYY